MKLTKEQLKTIIKEELEEVIYEREPKSCPACGGYGEIPEIPGQRRSTPCTNCHAGKAFLEKYKKPVAKKQDK